VTSDEAVADLFARLAAPFQPDEIRWRVGATTKDKKKGLALAYIDARDVMNRLDQVVGPAGWQDDYSQGPGGIVFCCLRIRLPDGSWIAKMDGAGATDVEADKGAVSGALKRAAVKYGIARYLYDLRAPWIEVEQRGTTGGGRPSYAIKASAHAGLRDLLERFRGRIADDDAPRKPEESRHALMVGWCEQHGITREMIFQFLGRELAGWQTLTEEDLDAISAQAKLVHDGMPPEDAFGHSAESKAKEIDKRIDSAGPAS
jgi:hypothetical protein